MTDTVTPAWLRQWLVDQVAELLGLPPAEIDLHRPLKEYGLSSRHAAGLGGELEDLLDRTLPATLLWEHPTIAALTTALAGPEEEPAEPPVAIPASGGSRPDTEPVAVIGIGCRLPGGIAGPEQFWRALVTDTDLVSEVPEGRWEQFADCSSAADTLARTTRWGGFLGDVAGFDAEFFGISPREAASMDPQQRILLEVVWEALEHAGVAPDRLRGSATGVFVGISGNEYSHLTFSEIDHIDAWSATGAAMSIAANRLSYVLDLRGPSMSVDTACSSSLVAVHLAMHSLRIGGSDLALAAGVNLLLGPGVTVNFDQMQITAPDGRCKTFDASANGMVRAEGAGVVVLKRLSDALRDGDRVLAVLRGSAVNSDGRSNGLTAPNPEAQEALLRRAYTNAGVDPGEVDFVEAHGTGTLLGDPIEARALGAVLGKDRPVDRPLLIGSVKTNVGHLEAAAGITGLIKTVLSLVHGRIPASLHFRAPNPHIDFDGLHLAVAARQQPLPAPARPARAGVSGFGFGGTNAHVVVEQFVPDDAAPETNDPRPAGSPPAREFVLASTAADRLPDIAAGLADWLAGPGRDADLGDLEHTLARRAAGRSRAVVAACDHGGLAAGLRALAAGIAAPGVSTGTTGRIGRGPVWVFPGQGSQWAGMARRLLADEPAFADAIDELDPLLQAEAGFSLREILVQGVEPAAVEQVQPLLFGVQVALARLWRSYGVEPAAVVGHSLGEVAAAVVAGALSPADGARVIASRSRLVARDADRGAMAVLELPAQDAAALLDGYPGVEIAVFNAPSQTVVAGPPDQVHQVVAEVEARGMLGRLVKVDYASHHPALTGVAAELAAELAGVTGEQPAVRCYTTVLDDPRRTPSFDAGYWAANLRQPVRFRDAVAAAVADGFTTFVEISPHPVLGHAVSESATVSGARDPLVLGTLRRDHDDVLQFHGQLGVLKAAGLATPPTSGRMLDLPTTPWRHTRYWVEPRRAATLAPDGDAHPLLGVHLEVPDDHRHVWRTDVGVAALPWLADHRVDGRPVMPAAAYVEIALAAAITVFDVPAEQVTVGEVMLQQPLPLDEHTMITTTFNPTGSREGRITVHTRPDGGEWVLHVSATVTALATGTGTADWRPERLADATELDPTDVYAVLRTIGLDYGPAFTGISRVSVGENAAVATVGVPAEAGGHPAFGVHPALLDAALQAFGAMLSAPGTDDDGTLYLPMQFGQVRVFADPSQGVQAHVRVAPAAADAGGMLGDLRLADAEGTVLLEVTDVFVRRVQRREIAAPLSERLLEKAWRRTDLPRATSGLGRYLLLTDGTAPVDEVFEAAATELVGGGHEVDAVAPDRLAEALGTGVPPVGVVLGVADAEPGPVDLDRAQQAVLTLASVVRTLVETGGTPPRLWLVTTGASGVLADEPVRPGPAALRGVLRVLGYEHPELRASGVDLDPANPAAEAGAHLAAELTAGRDDEVSWRSGQRYAARLTPAEPPESDAVVVRPGDAYVITGGLGGLGLFLARWLADRGAGRIILNGRSAPRPEAASQIAELTSAGADVEVVLGDIAEPGVAERLVDTARNGAELRGVVHAAAVFDDRTVLRLDAETLARTWRAKAYGAWRLHEATAGLDLDWWVGFSSAAALLGLPGQPAYASANAYLDALVAMRRALGLPGTTIAWGTWAEVGAAVGVDVPWLHPIDPREGLEVLEGTLASHRDGVGAMRLNAPRLVGAFPQLVETPFFAEMFADYAAAERDSADWRGIAAVREREPAEARRLVTAQLRARVAAVMGFRTEELDVSTPLTALGVDSLLAVRIRNVVQHDFELVLPVALMLRGVNVVELEKWVLSELGLGPVEPATAPAPPIPRQGSQPVLVPPRDAAERLVLSVWQDVLGHRVGVTQNFYEIGGDADRAAQVAALLAQRGGYELPVSELFRHPTIERMAAHFREQESTGSPLRVLRDGAGQPPLFLFHPGGGDTAVYRQLVELLDPRLPAHGFDRIEGAPTVEDRVDHYLPELRRVQRGGPYRLAGWSFGGFLAFEVAHRLHAAGEEVELVGLIDPILPLPTPELLDPVQMLRTRFERFGEFLRDSYGRDVELPYEELIGLDDEGQAELVVRTIRSAGLVNEEVSEAILRHQRTSLLDALSQERYDPPTYEGRVVYYSAAQGVPGGLRDPRYDRQDPARGWDEVCPNLEVITVPGHHLSLLDPPNVDVIGQHLRRVLTGDLRRVAA
ncbi:phthiocerol/phenolphthiocerol synthesis polyketide synthase type I PpsD [Longimycelium tulufanense]|uniref:Phthiocerol/phenolphthiocerol synthesis polyketide synthase type I PpsD n=1 Tax=Longimycelium tulufanense TaxID=907463 RepID=A0A8J3FVB1_9PSEU|nr:type I polyketide synthase [Longimycelium tulufanense]GGM56665.1 phthiocerol/phenolphthiocerol synthesis polyketide synthase type I PpsD [Longimycelium tulufanense]